MSGVVDSKGQQWEHCSYCNRFVKFPQNLGYQKPNNLLPYGRDICVICADIGIRTGLNSKKSNPPLVGKYMKKSNLQWFGTITSVAGSFTVALGYMLTGYLAFVLGAVSWLIVGFRNNNRPLIVLNGFFLAANMIGLCRALL